MIRDKTEEWEFTHPPKPSELEALRAENARLREALKPFAEFGQTEDGDIRDGLMRDRIRDWFGPSDFDAARAALIPAQDALNPPVQGNVSEDTFAICGKCGYGGEVLITCVEPNVFVLCGQCSGIFASRWVNPTSLRQESLPERVHAQVARKGES